MRPVFASSLNEDQNERVNLKDFQTKLRLRIASKPQCTKRFDDFSIATMDGKEHH
jgi:hypothetical protein